jgi:uncharacterized protein (DUF983 family)
MGCCGGKCHGPEFDEDREGVCEADVERFGGDGIRCPECGADVFHDAVLCQECGHAMTEESIARKPPQWVLFVAGAAVIGIVLAIMM